MFENNDSLAFYNKFYYVHKNKFVIEKDLNSILTRRDEKNIIDPVALIELANKNYMFADRTLIKGINRTPWMSTPNTKYDDWERNLINSHSDKKVSEMEVAKSLFELLKKEVLNYCQGKSNIGILLSGGMDSRIIAGVLSRLIKEKRIEANVMAITWGLRNSRDVVYAERLANSLGWDWFHLELTPDNLIENIKVTAELGCEFSPIHLHAMPKVRNIKGIDCILAASYGDSVGRGVYSGKHVTKLNPIDQQLINRYGMFQKDVFNEGVIKAHQDIVDYHVYYPQDSKLAKNELDYQHHYLRRQLNPCMAYINEKIPLFQAFTSPEVYKYMWSISPDLRNDFIYKYIIEMLDTIFQELPWSKTGKQYMESSDTSDSFSKEHHKYGRWIRHDLYELIRRKVLSSSIQNLNIFNMESLDLMLKLNKDKSQLNKHSRIDELVIWIASLSDTIERYNLISENYNLSKSKNKANILNKVEINAYLFLKNRLNKERN